MFTKSWHRPVFESLLIKTLSSESSPNDPGTSVTPPVPQSDSSVLTTTDKRVTVWRHCVDSGRVTTVRKQLHSWNIGDLDTVTMATVTHGNSCTALPWQQLNCVTMVIVVLHYHGNTSTVSSWQLLLLNSVTIATVKLRCHGDSYDINHFSNTHLSQRQISVTSCRLPLLITC